ncbi:cache domain-containing sensor histidine kinase [Gorillibacterium massiliense]|uniref:cache domain-containing sensor histidine kinase n=1 Tax=Gorillibacterium massiliense TaxID=1280390 RepID=UPI0004B7B5CB|nr:sensor histidine kinase [Gorillibacterium massiliense]
MKIKMSIFTKIVLLITLLLIPILYLYSASNQISVGVIHDEIQLLKKKDLTYFANEANSKVELLSTLGMLLSEDSNVRKLGDPSFLSLYTTYEIQNEKLSLFERIRLLTPSSGLDTRISVYFPESQEVISSTNNMHYDADMLAKELSPNRWTYMRSDFVQGNQYTRDKMTFIKHIVLKQASADANSGIIVEIAFPASELGKMLEKYKAGGKGELFFYGPNGEVISGDSSDGDVIGSLIQAGGTKGLSDSENLTLKVDGKRFLVNSAPIATLGWQVIEAEPLSEVLQPISKSNTLFYGSLAVLFTLGVVAAFMLYMNVHVPIRELIRSVQMLRKGNYSNRIRVRGNNEFSFLFHRFNEMSAEIEELIDKVYAEQLRSREANLKQLQSQINPHFLYNSFAMIRSLTRLGEKESVMDLAMHLSKYYRYSTRVEKQTTTIREELQLIVSYLEIQKLHLQRFDYAVEIPEEIQDMTIPRLLLQPLVENAIVHGLDHKLEDGWVQISAEQDNRFCRLIVSDNGVGMTPEELSKLVTAISKPPSEEEGCALWNIQQRLQLHFGPTARLRFESHQPEGLKVVMEWEWTAAKSE